MKKYIILIATVCLTVIFTDFIIHGVLLKSMYEATSQLWRPQADMPLFMKWMFFGQIVVGAFFAMIFTHGYKGKGLIEGVRYGILMGGYTAGAQLIMYAVAPYELSLTVAWIITGVVQAIVVGMVAALVCQKLSLKS